jgi:small GTP-binding protein
MAMDLRRIKRKALLLGDGAVGKTSLIRKFVTDKFDDKYITTIGTKITKKEISFRESNIELTLMMWDVLGQQGYTAVQSASYRGAEGAVMVCDLTRAETLTSIEKYWMPELEKVVGEIPIVIVGNKVDLVDQRQISEEALSDFARLHGAPHYLSSARTGERVEDLFRKLGELVLAERADISMEGGGHKEVKTLIDATDFLISDYCESYSDHETAMSIVRAQFSRAGVDVKAPSKDGLMRAIDYLAEAERGLKDDAEITKNRLRRRRVVEMVV